ncbi:MAG: hypothetical protein COS99_02155 [Candidatus Omnitrophica bacterium CG07_land_8_20_14_0_80_42_15]|uniref:Uncharacterized protein n=1 Tax=Candidatus Aquitaenariimonas noxiae TaxID=1974741 RepID=A0A2J0L1T4_9BACT|nr:MAG: hypothetical protein COS99_02155 [Candidatus Omnitrophica bacterium CG07_land_8_20_14_0_80_42_15]
MKSFYTLLIVIIVTVIFFMSYNKFLLDRSIEELKFSLNVVEQSESTEDAKDAKIVLELLLLDKLTSSKKFNSTEFAALEYAHNVMSKGSESPVREIKDAEINMKEILDIKNKAREIDKGPAIAALDRINNGMIRGADNLGEISTSLISGGKKEAGSLDIDVDFLNQANAYDKEWNLEEAKNAYEKLINDYPNYQEIKSLKLRLAYTYQKMGSYKNAEKLLNTIMKEYAGTVEAKVAQKLLSTFGEMQKMVGAREDLFKKIPSIVSKNELQSTYFKLGTVSMQILDFDTALDAFKKAIEQDSSTETASRAKFNLAWIYKLHNKLDESIAVLEELIKLYPDSDLVLDSKYQLADIYNRQGRYEEAINRYEEIADTYRSSSIAPIALMQTSMTYLYDLYDGEKSKEAFLKLREKYSDFNMAMKNSEYAQEVVTEERAPKGWLDVMMFKGAMGFAGTVLDISKPKAVNSKTPYKKIYTEKDMNEIVKKMLEKIGVGNIITGIYVDFEEGKIRISGASQLGKISIRGNGAILAAASRGGFRYKVEDYKFTLGNGNVPLPMPRVFLDRITEKINSVLTRKNLILSVEEVILTDHDLTIKGTR